MKKGIDVKMKDLTVQQKNIWNLQKYYPDTVISNLCGAIFYNDKRENKRLIETIMTIVKGHSGLRLCFVESEKVFQYAADNISINIEELSFDSREKLDDFAKAYVEKPLKVLEGEVARFVIFDLYGKSGVLVVLHHLVIDAWSFNLLAHEMEVVYEGLAEENFEYQGSNYLEFVDAAHEYLSSVRFRKDEKYWYEKYEIEPDKSVMKVKTSANASIKTKRLIRMIPKQLQESIEEVITGHSISKAVILETALLAYLFRINPESTSVTIGIPTLNRNNIIDKRTIGMFVSTMPLTVAVNMSMTAKNLADQVTLAHMEIFRHHRYPYSKILHNIREKHNFSGNLYNVMFSYQNASTQTDFETQWYSNGYSEVPFTIHVDNRDEKATDTVTIDYQVEVFKDEDEIVLILKRLWYILEQITHNVDIRIEDLIILPAAETEMLTNQFNETKIDNVTNAFPHKLFMERVEENPSKVALIFEEKKYTYQRVNELSNSLAHFLREKGVNSGDRVAVLLERDENIIFAQLAILRLGAVFVPVDSRYPLDRIKHIINDSKAKIVVKNLNNKMSFENSCDIEDWSQAIETQQIDVRTDPDAVCYIIFTSGSTGTPKGCTLTNKGIYNFCKNNNILDACNSLNKQNCVSVNTMSFDYFIAESLLPLSNGYTVVLASEKESMNQSLFSNLICKNDVNIVQTTPTRYEIFLDDRGDTAFAENFEIIVTSGEPLRTNLLQKFRQLTGAKIFNPLGPSECSVWIAGGELSEKEVEESDIHIGKPIANTQLYVLDKKRMLSPIGVAGELCIAGIGVGNGYINRQDLTVEKFVVNPFATPINHHGKIIYHTGDLVRWKSDGKIEYLGRMDTQVKIRGLRIELGEIENVMSKFGGIQLPTVVDKRDKNNHQYLVAYFTTENEIEVDVKELRQLLSKNLPQYMVPNFFMHLDVMPMTPSGKIDRKNLPDIDFSVRTKEYSPPKTRDEIILCKLLEELLDIDQMSVENNFFECGGDSLIAIEFVAKAHEKGVRIQLQDIFDFPSIRELANSIEKTVEKHEFYQNEDFSSIHAYLEQQDFSVWSADGRVHDIGNILLTGGTGYLGAHLLYRYLQDFPGDAYCLVRGSNLADATARLHEILLHYFGDGISSAFASRVHVLCADLQEDNFGLNEEYFELYSKVDTVINSAATVKHYGSYDYFHEINVESVEKLISFCQDSGCHLLHISTLSVSGLTLLDREMGSQSFDEKKLYIHQSLENVYIRSKFESERRILNEMVSGSISGKIYRIGNLTNRYKDGRFQRNFESNAFLNRIKALLTLGNVPNELASFSFEFTPVDLAAKAIFLLARTADTMQVFHVQNTNIISLDSLVRLFQASGEKIEFVSSEKFYERFNKAMKNPNLQHVYESFINEIDEGGKINVKMDIKPLSELTAKTLLEFGFEWPKIDILYIQKFVKEIERVQKFAFSD